MRRIADQPQAVWLGEWSRDVRGTVDDVLSRSAAARAVAILVAYNIPYRDCGLHSRGGAGGGDDYRRWILEVARGLGGRPSVVILEPDALAGADCLPARLRDERYVLIRDAVDVLTKAGAAVYVDAGNARWKSPDDMAGGSPAPASAARPASRSTSPTTTRRRSTSPTATASADWSAASTT